MEGLRDPALISLNDEIAGLDVRARELIVQLPGGDESGDWSLVIEGLDFVDKGTQKGDPEKVRAGLETIQAASDSGIARERVWSQLLVLWDQRRRLAEAERRRRFEQFQVITIEEAMGLLAQIQQVVINAVPEEPTRAKIAAGLRALAARNPR